MPLRRYRITFKGRVQGVGFRPAVHRCAMGMGLTGCVRNSPEGAVIEIETHEAGLWEFFLNLEQQIPPLARIDSREIDELAFVGSEDFIIDNSVQAGAGVGVFPADAAVCDDCLREFRNPEDRRAGYAFINCTNCGPRFTIIRALPYDRERTTMQTFALCPACGAEYGNAADRRYHAEPIACPVCGPSFRLLSAKGPVDVVDPLAEVISLIRAGRIAAIKGIGGYHLACDASNEEAVRELRRRKRRPGKPFALMIASLEGIRNVCDLGEEEAELLVSPAAPIVLLRRKEGVTGIATAVAPGQSTLGVMLPYAPHHHRIANAFAALVMTSGNQSDEPLISNEEELKSLLGPVADIALVHNREIAHKCDDSIVRIIHSAPAFIRRARGYVPDPLPLPGVSRDTPCILAYGADIKSAFAFTHQGSAILSQHLGDLDDARSVANYERERGEFLALFNAAPTAIAHDLHPDYHSTRLARASGIETVIGVQHHHAHLASCLADNGLDEPCIGVIYDGAGYGEDGNIWGGEILVGDARGYERAAHWKPVPLPGGDAAVREPWRTALSFLMQADVASCQRRAREFGEGIDPRKSEIVLEMVDRKLNSPMSSSMGRLFDAFAAWLGLLVEQTYEGHGPMLLESVVNPQVRGAFPYRIDHRRKPWIIDPSGIWEWVSANPGQSTGIGDLAALFHNTIADATIRVCEEIAEETGLRKVALSGGCFQNAALTESVIRGLCDLDLEPLTHRHVPANDGGIAYGQLAIASSYLSLERG